MIIQYKKNGRVYSDRRWRELQEIGSKHAKDLLQPYVYSKTLKRQVPSLKYIKLYGTRDYADKSELKLAE